VLTFAGFEKAYRQGKKRGWEFCSPELEKSANEYAAAKGQGIHTNVSSIAAIKGDWSLGGNARPETLRRRLWNLFFLTVHS